jgi:membrane protein DedA with SNARE-associated domain
MEELMTIFSEYGYLILFGGVLLDFLGAPGISVPLLLLAGALARMHRLSLMMATASALLAAVLADVLLYHLGRTRGRPLLHFVCRLTPNVDRCVVRTEGFWARFGPASVLLAKFAPGLATLAAPMAGVTRMPLKKFILYDALGTLVWVALLAGAGYFFSPYLAEVERSIEQSFIVMGVGLGLISLVVIAIKMAQWRRRRLAQAVSIRSEQAVVTRE